MTQLYNDYNTYLKKKFGCRVYKVGLDAGFTCPTRDGTKAFGGCAYCNERGSRSSYSNPASSVREQLRERIAYLKEEKGAKKFIAYFQAFSNTYAPAARLKAVYDDVLPFDEVVGISIGTRPDTVDEERLELVASYKGRYEVWMEYGLQTVHNRTLCGLNRGHTYEDFVSALTMTRAFGISVCAHVILGLPGETKEEMLATARELKKLEIEGVKVHLFHILKGSACEKLYDEGKITLLSQDEYADAVCDFLEHLSPKTIIQRLTGEGTRADHRAPEWALDKLGTLNKIAARLRARKGCEASPS